MQEAKSMAKSKAMIGIAWHVEKGESLEDAVRQATLRHKEKLGCWPSHILVDAKSFSLPDLPAAWHGGKQKLTVVSSPFVGKAYTFLLYRNLLEVPDEV